jgi:NADPH:quinone reductase
VRAVVLRRPGGPETLRVEEVADPVPVPGEVLVRVRAAGVNHTDLHRRADGPVERPRVLGKDAAGVRLDNGERVLVTGQGGCYAELVAVSERNVWPLPAEVDDATAAALGTPYKTAWWALLDVAALRAGETLFVQAGSSGTGQACIDLGRMVGARVLATAPEPKHTHLREYGAEPFVYAAPELRDVADVVFDAIGTDTFESSVNALRTGGRLVVVGALSGARVTFDVMTLMRKRARILGTGRAPSSRATVQRLIEHAAKGDLRPAIHRELPLELAAEAHRLVETRAVFGTVVLRP